MEKIRKFAKIRVWTGYLFLLVVIIFANPELSYLVVGTIFFVFGLIIRILAAGTLVKAEELVTGGIYQMTRNPLYLGSLFIGLGCSIMSNQPYLILLFFVIFIPIYSHMIKLEEEYLRQAFGREFEEYAARVPILFPAPGAPPGLLVNFSFKRYRANREFIGNIATLIVVTIIWLKYFYQ